MGIKDTLITDRTDEDVRYAKYLQSKWQSGVWTGTREELQEWAAGTKGMYRAADLNRVGQAIAELVDIFNAAGYAVDISPKTDWTDVDVPIKDGMDKFLSDLQAIRAAGAVYPTTPQAPSTMDVLTWRRANNIEQILLDIYDIRQKITENWCYSGEIYSGMV